MADRPLGTKKALLHHHRRLSHSDRADRRVLEWLEFLSVSVFHRRRDRRRICRDQLDNPGACAGALSRLHRSRHQRQLLDRRRAWRSGGGRASEPGFHRPGARLAAGLSRRRRARHRSFRHAYVDSREPTLAGHPRARRRSGSCGRRHRAAVSQRRRHACRRRRQCRDRIALCVRTRRFRRCWTHCSENIARARWSA